MSPTLESRVYLAEDAEEAGTATAEQLALLKSYRTQQRNLDHMGNLLVARRDAPTGNPLAIGILNYYGDRDHAQPDSLPVVVAPTPALAAPRERREHRTASPTRAGPSDDDGPAEPPSRLETREDIASWLAERRRVLTALTSQGPQLTLEEWAA
jgi:hypothetical protein